MTNKKIEDPSLIENLLKQRHYLENLLQNANNEAVDAEFKIMNLEEKLKNHVEFLGWIKEAFGNCETDEYTFCDHPLPFTPVSTSLNFFVDDCLSYIKKL
jgi:hypothetical protein